MTNFGGALPVLIVGSVLSFTALVLAGFPEAAHIAFDYIVIAGILVIMSLKEVKIVFPTLLTLITLDLYLTHFKVLMVASRYLSLEAFLICCPLLILAVAILFSKLRTLLKI